MDFMTGQKSSTNEPKLGVNAGNRGKGRPKGVPNKLNAQVKDMVRQALEDAGGVKYLVKQADENPTAFMTLVGKLLPIDLNANVNDKRTSAMTDDELEKYISSTSRAGTKGEAPGQIIAH